VVDYLLPFFCVCYCNKSVVVQSVCSTLHFITNLVLIKTFAALIGVYFFAIGFQPVFIHLFPHSIDSEVLYRCPSYSRNTMGVISVLMISCI